MTALDHAWLHLEMAQAELAHARRVSHEVMKVLFEMADKKKATTKQLMALAEKLADIDR